MRLVDDFTGLLRGSTWQTGRRECRTLLTERYDGFEALKGRKFIVDDENGQIMSSIIRSFLLGASIAELPDLL